MDCQRRFKVTNTNFGSYNVICICETWLNPGIPDSELLLNNHTIYRSDREHRNINLHGRSLIAVEKQWGSENIKMDVECCTIGKIRLISEEIYICPFYYPPQNSQLRYDVDCYHRILEAIPKTRKAVLCGDLNFPSTNWGAYWSTDKEEQDVLNILEERLLRKTLTSQLAVKIFLICCSTKTARYSPKLTTVSRPYTTVVIIFLLFGP